MQLTVLGFQSPYPGPGGATPGYLLKTRQGKQILIDCGSGVMSALAHYAHADQLDAVLLSHLHHDHLTDVFTLQYAVHLSQVVHKRQEPLFIYAPTEPTSWWEKLTYERATEAVPLKEGQPFSIGDVIITCYLTHHGIPCYAMSITDGNVTILYGADAGIETDWTKMGDSPDLFICEATFLEAQIPDEPIPHLSARQAAEAAQSIGAKALLLTHFHPDNDPNRIQAEASPHFSGTLHLASTGYTITLP